MLPQRIAGGVTILASYIVSRACRVIWPFLDPSYPHFLSQDNLALMRLADVLKVKRLMNRASVMAWADQEACRETSWNKMPLPLQVAFAAPPSSVGQGGIWQYDPALFSNGDGVPCVNFDDSRWKGTLAKWERETKA